MRASIQPYKTLCIPEKPHESCPFAAPCGPRRKKWSDISFSVKNLPVQACNSRAQGFSPPLTRRRSSFPPSSPNLVRTHMIERYQALRDNALASRVPPPSRRAPNWNSEEARTWDHDPQPITHRHRASTNRLNRESSQLAAPLEGESGPPTAGKTLSSI